MSPQPLIRQRIGDGSGSLPVTLHPVVRRVYAGRGVGDPAELDLDLARLLRPDTLKGIAEASALLSDVIACGGRIVIAGDYDADGATATAVGMLGLKALGAAAVDYVVPNRFTMGYGLSPQLVEVAQSRGAGLLVTVDNGIASLAGVAAAQASGMRVIVTDHHLPGPLLPGADAIVNPCQPGCGFASKNLAGVGVIFYLLLALRARLRDSGQLAAAAAPRLAELLDLVALGTVADVVKLDYNNRILVAQGLRRIRAGLACPGLQALLQAAGRDASTITAADLGFVLGPRLNAAGRLEDMTAGIQCLLAASLEAARPLAVALDRLNRERRQIESQMREEAQDLAAGNTAVGVCLFDPGWHEGVVGLVASRIKQELHRPVIAFARAAEGGLLKGSGRSIAGLHLRDVLAEIDALHPGLILRFGGHAMAAGLSLPEDSLSLFARAFDSTCAAHLDAEALHQVIETDGELGGTELCIATARALEGAGPWGQGFPEPSFYGEFEVIDARHMGADGRHVKYRLRTPGGGVVEAPHFYAADRCFAAGSRVKLVYRLSVNRFRGAETLELMIEEAREAT